MCLSYWDLFCSKTDQKCYLHYLPPFPHLPFFHILLQLNFHIGKRKNRKCSCQGQLIMLPHLTILLNTSDTQSSFPQKMPVINIEDLTEKDKLKMEVDQLKKEVTLERMLVSKCCEEVRDYVEERSGEDPLVKGVPEDKNPFKELKGGCVIS
ncbi:guanine nucleotide-binding protein G(T) subunit gamma-T1 isoform X1 [Pteropus medius]|nr:guanine nucleotide-binding protein G(T) subunit gamma-T1 isoform X1 [Pteropus giganteus]